MTEKEGGKHCEHRGALRGGERTRGRGPAWIESLLNAMNCVAMSSRITLWEAATVSPTLQMRKLKQHNLIKDRQSWAPKQDVPCNGISCCFHPIQLRCAGRCWETPEMVGVK